MKARIFVLKGDGIGPEVVSEAIRVMEAVSTRFTHKFEVGYGSIGGESLDRFGEPLTASNMNYAFNADAVLLGSVGGTKWELNSKGKLPEDGLLSLRKNLGLSFNIRPIKIYPQLIHGSPLKPERVEGVQFDIVRELTSGLYFGKPKKRLENTRGLRAIDAMVYTEKQVERILKLAFEMAKRTERKHLHLVDKANVLETSRLWREVANDMVAGYPSVKLHFLLVDNSAAQIILNPRQFDVVVTENMFGDILSDEAAVLTGSLGMIPSASLSNVPYVSSPRGRKPGLYEPIHGSAPELAGRNVANPIATILSLALMLELSLNLKKEAEAVRAAIESVISDGYITRDYVNVSDSMNIVTTSQMGTLIAERVRDY